MSGDGKEHMKHCSKPTLALQAGGTAVDSLSSNTGTIACWGDSSPKHLLCVCST